MEQQGLSNRQIVRQDTLITNSKASYSKAEIDLIMVILTEVKKEDDDFKDYSFTLDDLRIKTGKSLTDLTTLKTTAKRLMSKVLEVEHSPKKWEFFHWFSYFRYDNGLITCRFDKAMKPYILQIQNQYTLANIKDLLKMDSSYSKRIYMLLMEYRKIGHREFLVQDLQELLKVPKSYKQYSKFKQGILTPALQDINKFGEIEATMEEIKTVRKVTKLVFILKLNHFKLEAFISWIRKLHVNQDLAYSKIQPQEILVCNEKGFLYCKYNQKILDKKSAKLEWENIHERWQDKGLLYEEPNLFSH